MPATALALDRQRNIYLAGDADPYNSSIRATPGAFQTKPSTPPGVMTALLMKLRPGGRVLAYATYLGETGSGPIAVDSSGNLYVGGETNSPNFPVTPGAFQTKLPSTQQGSAFIAKLNANGSGLVYATFLGGSVCSNAGGVRLTAAGDLWVEGFSCSNDFPVTAGALPGTPKQTSAGAMFLARLNASGTALVYSTLIPDSSDGLLDVDASGNAYLLTGGDFGFPVSAGAFQACKGGSADPLALQFGPDGQLNGATYLGGTNFAEGPAGIFAAGNGSVYITGQSLGFPTFAGTPPSGVAGSDNLTSFVAKIVIDNPQQKNGPCISPLAQNAANFDPFPISPGELVTLRGYAFGPETPAYEQVGADGKVTTELAGVRVWIDEKPAPLLYVQSKQINAIVPWQLSSTAPVNVRVDYNGTSTNTAQVPVGASAPGVFVTDYVTQQAAALNEDGTVNSPSNPAKSGSVVSIFGTGGGLMTSVPEDGSFTPIAPTYPLLTLPVQVTFDAQPGEVLYTGAAPTLVSGVFQINARLPNLPPGQSYISTR
jgi:uncharacterized protein (TIGR03437 family)